MPIPHLTHFTGEHSALGQQMADAHVEALQMLVNSHPRFGSHPLDRGPDTHEMKLHLELLKNVKVTR